MKFPKETSIIDPRTLSLKYFGKIMISWMWGFDEKDFYKGIVISGNAEFCNKIIESLKILEKNDSFRYKIVARYVKGIYCNRIFQEGVSVSGLAVLTDGWVQFNAPVRIASYIVRLGVMTQLFNRFHTYRVTEEGRREKLIAYKQELKAANKLGSTMSHIMHLEKFLKSNHVIF